MNSKLLDIYNNTPENIGVYFGKKKREGKYTDERCVVFTVEKKKALSELSDDEILPSQVEVDGKLYLTDVIEVGKLRIFACDSNTEDNCYDWYDGVEPIHIDNWDTFRPIAGGIQITADSMITNTGYYVGTLGAVVVDNETDSLVGLTNNHVIIKNAFYTSERDSQTLENEESDNVYQSELTSGYEIGKVLRYVPLLKAPDNNYVDGAITSLNPSVIDVTESFKQYGLSYGLPMEFASTAEIDSLEFVEKELYSSGRSTGAKEGTPCGLTLRGISGGGGFFGYYDNGIPKVVSFIDLLVFSRIDETCLWPIFEGDSGSVLIADFEGSWKIIGLCFGGNANYGYACRIDNVASELNISAWDGTPKNFIDLSSQEIITVNGTSSDKTIECDGKTYWQIGAGLTNNPCVE